MIRNYTEFCTELIKAGFSGAVSGKDDGVFGLFRYGWGAQVGSSLNWHSGDPDTDPWEWRVRVLENRNDIAYGKVFFRKAGYITKEWYPFFLAARRGGQTFEDFFEDGLYSQDAKRIFETLLENGPLPLHEIKIRGGFKREDASRVDKALTDLQMGLFITMSGHQRKVSKAGVEYGWADMVYCTVEEFWPPDIFEKAAVSAEEAETVIKSRVFLLNPQADQSRIRQFIFGR